MRINKRRFVISMTILLFLIILIVKIIINLTSLTSKNVVKDFDVSIPQSTEESPIFNEISIEEIPYIESGQFELSNDAKDSILSLIGEDLDNVGLIFYDLESDSSYKLNESKVFTAASTYKVLLNIVTIEKINLGEISLSDIIYYSDIYYEEGTGIIQEEFLEYYDIEALLEYSIVYSDNIASNMLIEYLGGFGEFRRLSNEILGTSLTLYENTMTSEDMLLALKYIYSNRDKPNYNTLLDNLKNTIFHNRLDKYIPNDIVAHKIGSNDSFIHDAGIIFTDEPYILIIYTDGVPYSEELIAQISKVIYLEKNTTPYLN